MGIIRKFTSLFFFFTALTLCANAQNTIDSLINRLNNIEEKDKVETLIDLAYAYDSEGQLDLAQENANKVLNLSDKINDKKSKANALNLLSLISLKRGKSTTSISYAQKAITNGLEINNKNILADAYMYMGHAYYSKSDFQNALQSWEESLKYYQGLGNKTSSAQIMQFIGVIYKKWSEYNDAIDYYEKALDIYNELGEEVGMANIYGNLGNIYYYSGIDYDNALENYKKALVIFQKDESRRDEEANILISIGLVYNKKGLTEEALKNFQLSLSIANELNNEYRKAHALSNIGNIYLSNKDFGSALENFNEALTIFEGMESKTDIALTLMSIGELYHAWGKHSQAKDFFMQSIELCEELELKTELSDLYKQLSIVLSKMNDYKNAYTYHRLYSEQKDSIFSTDYKNMITEWNARLKNEEQARKLQEQQFENEQQQAEIKRKNIIQYFMGGGIFVVLMFSLLLYKQFMEKKRANILLRDQNEEIKLQRDKIFEQNKEITDSIEYASKIQSAMLPPDRYISSVLPDHFVLYRPRDIVSGDFYWLNQYNKKLYFCAADCTGHGVPGAFMSMLGIALLNEIINQKGDFSAAEVLNNLRSQVVKSMHQKGHEGETQDGMDIAFCVLDFESNHIQFSGAFNPLFIIRNGELLEFKGDKMPIGVHIKQDVPFTNHETDVLPGDQLYIFSDGYADQFGGPKRKKFLIKRFRELLINISAKPMSEQKNALENVIDEWMGSYDQIDDILVFGVKI